MISVGYFKDDVRYIFDDTSLAQAFVEKYNLSIDNVHNKILKFENEISNIKTKWLEENTKQIESPKILNTLRRIEQLRVFEENKQQILETSLDDYKTYKSLKTKDLRRLQITSTEIIINPILEVNNE